MATVTKTVVLVSNTTWYVPNTWNSSNNTVICIGGGAGGGANTGNGRGGGGGGARSISTNVSVTPGSTINISIGAGGGSNSAGGDTSFNSGTVLAKGGSTTTSSTGGAGGASASGTGGTKYSGGSGGNGASGGGGGGGGCAGSTAGGSNGSNATTNVGGAGGAGGATGGATGSSTIGYDNGGHGATLGSNYAGSGGAGANYDSYGSTAGGAGAAFGAGGGAGYTGGAGAQGAIIASWTYQSILPASGQVSMYDVEVIVDKSGQVSLNDSDVRTAFGKASGQIAISDGYSKYAAISVVTYINTTGTGTSPLSLLSGGSNYGGWQEGDLAIAYIQNGTNAYPTQDNGGQWKYIPNSAIYSSHGYWLQAFYKVLKQGDSNFYFTESSGGVHIVILRGASEVTAVGTVNRYGASTNPGTVVFTGITKASNSKALLGMISNRYPYAGTNPTGWTTAGTAGWTYFYVNSAWIDSSSYTNGTNITFGIPYTGYYTTGILLEVT